VSQGPGTRFGRYFLSRANLVGLGAAVVMGILGAVGVLGSVWPVLVVGGYAVGALVAPREKGHRVDVERAREARDVVAALDTVRAQAKRHTDDEVVSRIDRIGQAVAMLATEARNDPQLAANWETVRQIALHYLPATLENYLNVPNVYRRAVRGAQGKTAHRELISQLDLLQAKIEEIAGDVGAGRFDEMLQHGQFLQARFSDPLTW
jgi:hypothetical protein